MTHDPAEFDRLCLAAATSGAAATAAEKAYEDARVSLNRARDAEREADKNLREFMANAIAAAAARKAG